MPAQVIILISFMEGLSDHTFVHRFKSSSKIRASVQVP